MNIERDWKEDWIDRMGLIVALSGSSRFEAIDNFKRAMVQTLTGVQRQELHQAIKNRFTPSNGQDGCPSGIAAVKAVTG